MPVIYSNFNQISGHGPFLQRKPMAMHPLAGQPAPDSILENIPRLVSLYYSLEPDLSDPAQHVAFGTSGHRGCSASGSFNESHILAISQAVCEYRAAKGIDGPMFLGIDTHALSEPALISAVEVFAANGVELMMDKKFNEDSGALLKTESNNIVTLQIFSGLG